MRYQFPHASAWLQPGDVINLVVHQPVPTLLTDPEVEPSWADLPLTLKDTPLGAVDLTSRLPRPFVSRCSLHFPRLLRTSRNVVKVSVQEL